MEFGKDKIYIIFISIYAGREIVFNKSLVQDKYFEIGLQEK